MTMEHENRERNEIVIRVARIALVGRHGCEAVEAEVDAPFELDLELRYPEPIDAGRDDFGGRPDYGRAACRAAELFAERRYRLIEPLAARIAERLLNEYPISAVAVTIRKLKPAIPLTLAAAEITVTRRRA